METPAEAWAKAHLPLSKQRPASIPFFTAVLLKSFHSQTLKIIQEHKQNNHVNIF